MYANIGGILQGYALQTVLERLGHKVEIIVPLIPEWVKWLILFFCRRRLDRIWVIRCTVKSLRLSPFVRKKIRFSRRRSYESIKEGDYDAIVVGSDQIWRKQYIHTTISNIFLKFTYGWQIKRIAYAASFGVDGWQFDETETNIIRQCLSEFSAVSVREKSGVKLLREYAGCESIHVLDPTMLLSAEDYLSLASAKVNKSGGGLVSYILDHREESEEFVNGIACAKGLVRRELNCNKGLSIEEWITGIASADLLVTDSFHGCVFSIIFRKPLIFTVNNNRGGARFPSLIETFGIENNCVPDLKNFNPQMNYDLPADIDKRVAQMQSLSMDFLLKNIGRVSSESSMVN